VQHKYLWPVVLGVTAGAAVVLWASGMFSTNTPEIGPRPPGSKQKNFGHKTNFPEIEPPPGGSQQATFGNGCFWCTEAVFQQVPGVHSVVSGYSGGHVKNPTYQQVCTRDTGHAEVVQITFDPKVVSFQELLEVFWQTHDPTTLNRQGPDSGPQYRSVIFYHTPEQKDLAEHFKKKLDTSGAFAKPIVTEIVAFSAFYPAEKYHQNYFRDNPQQPYCAMFIQPKLERFAKVFKDKFKGSSAK
jgi:peptide-methionine (S)-S-oxide reductase